MVNHDSFEYDADKLLTDLNAVKRISPEFSDLSMDIQEVMKESSNPSFLAALLYKLIKEREETNRVLKSLEKKFEQIQESLIKSPSSHTKLEIAVLSEPDQHIMQLIQQSGTVTAQDVQARLAYKGTNAASQRLNKLAREGQLKRIRSGKKVFFTL
ncbi:MAG: hypothetical protein WC874_01120 [Candidatus Izemoplasmatales bacterium]|jgi:predicted HTH transcriptional regulator